MQKDWSAVTPKQEKRALEVGRMPVSGEWVVQQRVGPCRIALRKPLGAGGEVLTFSSRLEATKHMESL